MKRKLQNLLIPVVIVLISATIFAQDNGKAIIARSKIIHSTKQGNESFKLENKYLCRVIAVKNGVLQTTSIENKRIEKTLTPLKCDEFLLRISKGVAIEGTIKFLTNKNFRVAGIKSYRLNEGQVQGWLVRLKDSLDNINLEVHYELGDTDFYCRKFMKIKFLEPATLEKVVVEDIDAADASQPYRENKIYARGEWKPNLGQPVYTNESAFFWGIEFPAAVNTVTKNTIECAYFIGNDFKKGDEYITYKSVLGAADDKDYIDDCFFSYIDRIRIRPLRLQIQYNSWFDYGHNVTQQTFAHSVNKINDELVVRNHCQPLNAYVIDDGWQDANSLLTDTIWRVNQKFDPEFEGTINLLKNIHANLGLWLSPGCFFGSNKMVPVLRKAGYEALTNTMSMTGERYMGKLEDRVLQLTKQGAAYFKFDGIFGHLNIRDFEINGRGTPLMPQLQIPDTLAANDELLNDPKYDELKTYYLTKGSERLMQIFSNMAKINPSVYIAITNGAYLSPWWLQYVDVIWLINAGDAARGGDRTGELVYRDNIYYRIWKTENTKFPMNAIFNHEPKKDANNKESADVFRDYLFMNLSRGTGFIELYLKTDSLKTADWDVLAEGLKWSQKFFPAFKHVRMIGGMPSANEVYGYAGWGDNIGYLSLHNPSDKEQSFEIKLDRSVGFDNKVKLANIIFQLHKNDANHRSQLISNQTIRFVLKPREIMMLGYQK